jgi:hypothetical protein
LSVTVIIKFNQCRVPESGTRIRRSSDEAARTASVVNQLIQGHMALHHELHHESSTSS